MKSLKLTDDERAAKRSFNALSIDEADNEIYIGLSRDESEWMLNYERKYGHPARATSPTRDEKRHHIELFKKHDKARLQAIWLKNADTAGRG